MQIENTPVGGIIYRKRQESDSFAALYIPF